MSQRSDEVRRGFKESDDKRDAGLTTPEDVVRYDDIVYGTDSDMQVLDVYRPKDRNGSLPVIINVHGGGWVYGSKEVYQYYCMSLAQRGFAVVNFTYRLAPEHKFPACLEDTNLVVEWVHKNAKTYGLDLDACFMVGDSAGAHIAALYAIMCTNKQYSKRFSFKVPDSFCPKALALNCGIYHINQNEYRETTELMSDLMPEGGTKEELEGISVIHNMTEDFPPAFVMTANGDFLKEEAFKLVRRFMELQVPFQFGFYGTPKEELCHVFHCNMRLEQATRCNDDECVFFQRFFYGNVQNIQ